MPRSSTSSRSSSTSRPSLPSKVSVAPPMQPYPFRPTNPTTGQMLKESIVSGVGSGIGFGVGSRIVSGLFGAPVVAVEKVGSAVTETKLQSTKQEIISFVDTRIGDLNNKMDLILKQMENTKNQLMHFQLKLRLVR